MTQITLSVDDSEVKQSFTRAALAVEKLPDKVVRAEMETAHEAARIYPSELPGQKYKRTGKRYEATKLIRVEVRKYRIESNPRYKGRSANPYVLGDYRGQGQAKIHAGRWLLMFDVVQRAYFRIIEKAEAYLASVTERNGTP